MARKKPSRHTADQFALFVQRITGSLEGDQGATFAAALGRLIHNGSAANSSSGIAPAALQDSAPTERPPSKYAEQAARNTVVQRDALFQLIGQLVLSWSNNENLLGHVLMLLLGTDDRSAAAVFATLTTTRARLDLVRRLMMLNVADPATRRELEGVLERFSDAGRVRNEVLHAMHFTDEPDEITEAQAMHYVEKAGRPSFDDRQPIDEKRFVELRDIGNEMASLNRDLRELLPRLKAATARAQAARRDQ